MSSTQAQLRSIHTTTLTPTLKATRKYLRILSLLVFIFSLWLTISLFNCSIDPELSTELSHPLGSVTHWVAAHLIYVVGVCSFSLCSLLMWTGVLLWRYHIPKISIKDFVSYLAILVMASSYLEISLPHQRLFGAPLGGITGEFLGQTLLEVHWFFAQIMSICALLLIFLLNDGYHKFKQSPKTKVTRGQSKPVHSMNQEHELRSHILQAHDLEVQDVDNSSLDPSFSFQNLGIPPQNQDLLYDDRDLLPSEPVSEGPRLTRNQAEADFYFSFDESLDATPNPEPNSRAKLQLGPRLTEASIENPINLESDFARHFESQDNLIEDFTHPEVIERPKSNSRDELKNLPMPKASRSRIIETTLQQMNLAYKPEVQHDGSISDTFTFNILHELVQSLQDFSFEFNQRVRRTLGMSEPPIHINQEKHEDQVRLCFSWPKRDAQFPSAQEGIQKIRALGSQSELTLYLGEHTSSVGAYLPFNQVSSLLIAASSHVDPYMGLDLVITNLVYQASPKELRLLVIDSMREESPFVELPHLYSPILEGEYIEEALSWFAIECRRRLSQFTRKNVESFQEFNQLNLNQPLLRIVLVIPNLDHLSSKQLRQVTDCLKKLERTQYDIGLHMIMNTRNLELDALPVALVQEVKSKLILACETAEDSLRLQMEGAEWLLNHYDMLLEVSDGVHRIHGWQFSYASFTRVLRVFANNVPVEYISPECIFIQTVKQSTLS